MLRVAVLLAIALLGLLSGTSANARASSTVALSVTSGSSAGHTCAVTGDHDLLCWGGNSYGQLGDGTTQNRSSPVAVPALDGTVAAVATGHQHTCALTLSGGVVCWGRNSEGQLGDGTTTDRPAPVAVSGLGSGVVAIGAGFAHSCALLSTGGVRCWGNNFHGQIGDGTASNVWTTPRNVTQLAGVAAISSGDWHNCALLASGGVRCWGENLHGQLGNGQSSVNQQRTPVATLLDGPALDVAAGATHTCALLVDTSVWCWGRNTYGQLGSGALGGLEDAPVPVSSLPDGATSIAAGNAHTCATAASEATSCWGRNQFGQLGDGTMTDRTAPVAAVGTGASSVTAGEWHACTLRPGAVACWGRNDAGQLGQGNTVSPGMTAQVVPALAAGVGGLTDLTRPARDAQNRGESGFAVLGGFAVLVLTSTLARRARLKPGLREHGASRR